jgi:UDP-glucuronate decarboxylase
MAKDDGRVVSNFINQALENENITIYGDGSQTRSFCYVKDMVRGIKQVMQGSISYYQNEDKIKSPINIGNPREFTINKLANKVLDLTESKSKIIYKDLPSDDPKQRKPNIELLQSMYKWKPYYTLEDGLHNTIKYFTYGS